MAAHSYRAWLFQHEGLTVWNAQWYGGHHVLGYSLLFAPLAAAIGPGAASACSSAVAAVALFVPLARAAAPSPSAGAAASWLFTAGVLSNVAIGRMPFLLGIALGVGAWSARARRSGACSRACSRWPRCSASPVAGVFLMLGALAKLLADGPPGAARPRCGSALPALRGRDRALPAVPRGRDRPLHGDRVLADARDLRRAASRCSRPGGGRCGPAGCCTWSCWSGAFVVPSPFGQNALRLGVLAGPVGARARAPQARAGARAGGRRRRAAVPAVAARRARRRRGARRPEHPRSPSRPRRATSSRACAKPGERVEVPMTVNHWEAADLAKVVPLARGWERQLDQKANPIFYDGEPLTAVDATTPGCARTRSAGSRCRTRRWTTPRAPRRSCSSAGRSSSSSSTTRRAGGSGRSAGTDPPASDGAKLLAAGPNWFMVDAAQADRRALPLHAVLVDDRRLREPRAAAAGREVEPARRRRS